MTKLPKAVRVSYALCTERPPLRASEDDLERVVMRYALDHGWRRVHFTPAKVRSDKLITPFKGERGYPDFTAVRGPMPAIPGVVGPRPARFIVRELKKERGVLSTDQDAWIEDMRRAGVDAGVWRPSQLLTEIIPTLL